MNEKKKAFDQVWVTGTGTLAVFCAEYAKQRGYPVFLYDMGRKPSAMMKKQAERKGIPYASEKPPDVFSILCQTEDRLLLVSAINEWIVPAAVLDKENVTAINLHQALLPAHPGRNAEAWAIYDRDEKAGITWHRMESKVDKGDILIQKEIRIEADTTAFSLFRKQIDCACEAFAEIFEPLAMGRCSGEAQPVDRKVIFHYNKDIPNEGWLNPDWDGKRISAFLRAMDYGILRVWDPPRLRIDKDIYIWKKYQLDMRKAAKENDSLKLVTERKNGKDICHIRITKQDMEILLKNCTKLEEERDGKTYGDIKGITAGSGF